MSSNRKFQIALVAICLLALLLRSYRLTSGPINLDEGYTILAAKMGFIAPFRLGPCDSNPPGASLVYSIWLSLFGSSRTALEMLAVICGVVSLLLTYLLANRMFNSEISLGATFLAAISTYQILFSQFIRIYAFALCGLLFSILLLLEHRRQARNWTALLFISASFVVINLHYYSAIALFSVLLSVYFAFRKEKQFVHFVIRSGIILGLLFVPTLIWQIHVIRELHRSSWIEPVQMNVIASIFYHFSSESIILLVVFLSLFIYGMWRGLLAGDERARTILLVGWIGFPIAFATLFSLTGGSILHVRYFVFSLVPFLILVASGWVSLPSQGAQRILACVVLLGSAGALRDYFRQTERIEQEAAIFNKLASEYQSGDAILHTSRCSFVSSIYANEFRYAEYVLADAVSGVLSCTLGGPGEVPYIPKEYPARLWLVDTDCFPHRSGAASNLLPSLALANKYPFSNGSLYLFAKPPSELYQSKTISFLSWKSLALPPGSGAF